MLRPLLLFDRPIIDEWISRDPVHSAQELTADFFLTAPLSFAVEDSSGSIMFIRIDPETDDTVRMFIQFDNGQKLRTARALISEFPVVADLIRRGNAKHIIFDSVSEPLVRFCQKHFEFVRIPDTNDFIKDL